MSEAAERRIQDAIRKGEFDDLPGQGRPLEGLDRPYDPHWWVKEWLAREREADQRAEDLLEIERMARRLWAATSLERLGEVMDEIDTERAAAGLDPLDRDETKKLWLSVRRRQV